MFPIRAAGITGISAELHWRKADKSSISQKAVGRFDIYPVRALLFFQD